MIIGRLAVGSTLRLALRDGSGNSVVVAGSSEQGSVTESNGAPDGITAISTCLPSVIRNGVSLPEDLAGPCTECHHAATVRAARVGVVCRQSFFVRRNSHIDGSSGDYGRACDDRCRMRIYLCNPKQLSRLAIDGHDVSAIVLDSLRDVIADNELALVNGGADAGHCGDLSVVVRNPMGPDELAVAGMNRVQVSAPIREKSHAAGDCGCSGDVSVSCEDPTGGKLADIRRADGGFVWLAARVAQVMSGDRPRLRRRQGRSQHSSEHNKVGNDGCKHSGIVGEWAASFHVSISLSCEIVLHGLEWAEDLMARRELRAG